jgi:hypothetical protein
VHTTYKDGGVRAASSGAAAAHNCWCMRLPIGHMQQGLRMRLACMRPLTLCEAAAAAPRVQGVEGGVGGVALQRRAGAAGGTASSATRAPAWAPPSEHVDPPHV